MKNLELTCQRVYPFSTGCDIVSSFKGKAKKSAWLTWKSFTTATDVIRSLMQNPFLNDEAGYQNVVQVETYTVKFIAECKNISVTFWIVLFVHSFSSNGLDRNCFHSSHLSVRMRKV